MKSSHLKLVIIVVSILYGIHIVKKISYNELYFKNKLDDHFFKSAIPEYFLLLLVLLVIGYAFKNEKDINVKRSYLGLISLALATTVTSLSAHLKLLTLPAFTVIFFWALTHSLI